MSLCGVTVTWIRDEALEKSLGGRNLFIDLQLQSVLDAVWLAIKPCKSAVENEHPHSTDEPDFPTEASPPIVSNSPESVTSPLHLRNAQRYRQANEL